MMNNLLNAIVIGALVGTVVLAPAPQPPLPPVASRPTETAAASPAINRAGAKAAIEACGYIEVSVLGPAADGAWRAKAFIGSAEVLLTVDAAGKVSTD